MWQPTKNGELIERLLLLYRLLIRSQLDYGNFIYWSAWKSYVKTLDLIYHGGLRFLLEAFRTSPTENLYAEANEAPANIRSHKLALQYDVKLMSCPANPVHNNIFYPKYKELFQKNEKTIKHFGLRMEIIIGETDMDLTKVHKTILPSDIPSWIMRTPNVNNTKFYKNKTHPLIFQEKTRPLIFQEKLEKVRRNILNTCTSSRTDLNWRK